MPGNKNSGQRPKPATIVERQRGKGNGSDSTIFEAPEHLSETAAKEWYRATELLANAGIIEGTDTAALEAYCTAYARWVEAEEQLRKHGVLIKAPKNDYPMQSPYLSVANQAWDRMVRMLNELGMTPASRSRLPKKETDNKQRNNGHKTTNKPDGDPRDLLEGLN